MAKSGPSPSEFFDIPYAPGPLGPDGQPLDPNWGDFPSIGKQPPFTWTPVDPSLTPPRVDPVTGQPYPTGAGDPTTGEGWPVDVDPFAPQTPAPGTAPAPGTGGPLIGSIDPTGGTSGSFDLDTVEGLDQAIAQLQSQIDASSGGAVPDYSAFFKSPGYEFRLGEGIRAIDRSAAARGMLMSGGTLRELQRYGQGLAATEFGNYANRLSSLAGIGQGAAFDTGRLGSAAGAQVGQGASSLGETIMAGGTAQGAGIIGAGNAWQNAIGNAVSAVQQWGGGGGWQPSAQTYANIQSDFAAYPEVF